MLGNNRRKKLNFLIIIALFHLVVLLVDRFIIRFDTIDPKKLKWKRENIELEKRLNSIKIFCFIVKSDELVNETSIIWISDVCNGIKFIKRSDPQVKDMPLDKESFEPLEQFRNDLTKAEIKAINYSSHETTSNIFNSFREVYSEKSNYDWYLKVNSNTFIFSYNLRMFLLNKTSTDPFVYGFRMKAIKKDSYLSGGAGYVFSKEVFRRVGMNLLVNTKFCVNNANEDIDVLECMYSVGVEIRDSHDDKKRERFHPFNVMTHLEYFYRSWWIRNSYYEPAFKREAASETTISFNQISFNDMRRLHKLWLDYKEYVMDADLPEDRIFRFTSILYQYMFP